MTNIYETGGTPTLLCILGPTDPRFSLGPGHNPGRRRSKCYVSTHQWGCDKMYLSSICNLAPNQSPGSHFQVTIGVYDHWTFAAEL
jgi:hypothetical protein